MSERDKALASLAAVRGALEQINERAHHHPGCRRDGDVLKCSEYCAVGIARRALARPDCPSPQRKDTP